jgi:hypothetical protein
MPLHRRPAAPAARPVFARLSLELLEDRVNPVLVTNGIAPNLNGSATYDITFGGNSLFGSVLPQQQTVTGLSGTQFQNVNFLETSFNFIQVDPNAGAEIIGGGFGNIPGFIVQPTTPITNAAGVVTGVSSVGAFFGQNDLIFVTVTTQFQGGSVLFTTISVTSNSPFGFLRLGNYLDASVLNPTVFNDQTNLFYEQRSGPNLRLMTVDPTEGVGLAQTVLTNGGGVSNARFEGYAADGNASFLTFLEPLLTTIANGTQPFSRAGTIDTGSLTRGPKPAAFPAINFGNQVFGPANIETALSFLINPGATSASVTFGLQLIQPKDLGALDLIVVGADSGSAPRVIAYDPIFYPQKVFDGLAFDPAFLGGVRVASGDVNGDGSPDIIVGAGPGAQPHIVVIDTLTNNVLFSFLAFDPQFVSGLNVGAGDINGDGVDEVLVSPGFGAGPHVKVFQLGPGLRAPFQLASFFAFDPRFQGGITIAGGDLDGQGPDEIIVGAGVGGHGHVVVIDAATLTPRLSILAFPDFPLGNAGIFVAGGTFTSELNRGRIVIGVGVGAPERVRILEASSGLPIRDIIPFSQQPVSLNASDALYNTGVRVAVNDLPFGGRTGIIAGSGPARAGRITFYDFVTNTLMPDLDPFLNTPPPTTVLVQPVNPFAATFPINAGIYVG